MLTAAKTFICNLPMSTIHIKNLRLRAIIGIYPIERKKKQDVVINIKLKYDSQKAINEDTITHAIDYKKITKKIIIEVEKSKFQLLESLADFILKIITKDKKVVSAEVEVDKPQALRYADSVSVSLDK